MRSTVSLRLNSTKYETSRKEQTREKRENHGGTEMRQPRQIGETATHRQTDKAIQQWLIQAPGLNVQLSSLGRSTSTQLLTSPDYYPPNTSLPSPFPQYANTLPTPFPFSSTYHYPHPVPPPPMHHYSPSHNTSPPPPFLIHYHPPNPYHTITLPHYPSLNATSLDPPPPFPFLCCICNP